MIVPVLSLVMAPVEAIAILVLIELPNIVYLIPRSMRECELKTVAPMMCRSHNNCRSFGDYFIGFR